MSNEASFFRSPCPRYGLVANAELPPSTSNHNNVPQLDGHQLDTNHAGAWHGQNHTDYGHWAQYRDNPYRNNLWYEDPPPPAANLEGQYANQRNSNVGYAPLGNAQHCLAAPGPPPGHHIPPAHDLPNDGVRDRPPSMPGVGDAFPRSVPESAPSGMLAMEGLKHLADRYLHDPGAHVDTLRMGLSPSGGRLRVMIVLDIDI